MYSGGSAWRSEIDRNMRRVKDFVLRSVAGEYVLIPTGETTRDFNGMISLSDSARLIWENLEKVSSLDEMTDVLTAEFSVDRQTAKDDAYDFIKRLVMLGFVEPTEEDKSW